MKILFCSQAGMGLEHGEEPEDGHGEIDELLAARRHDQVGGVQLHAIMLLAVHC